MSLLFLTALALSADCFAVSVSGGIKTKNPSETAFKFAVYFGAAQTLMLLAGWFAGAWFRPLFGGIAGGAAFAFLSLAGLRMIFESARAGGRKEIRLENPGVLSGLALAVSIDALFAGTGLSIMRAPLFLTAMTVGITAFLVSFAGVYAGGRVGENFRKNAELAGGALLILIGLRILL